LQVMTGWGGSEAASAAVTLGQTTAASSAPVVIREASMLALQRTVARVAAAPVNVLVLGETGVGKDVMASLVHELSDRAQKPFVRLNCASLPEQLLESELFGHERGAFTGAVSTKRGLLESADGGTVFLDEIGDMPLLLQAKLLRALESGEVIRVGALQPRKVDLRFVAATNRELAADVSVGHFRRDLFYRLSCVTLSVPPLRERPSEIEPLAQLFVTRACARFGSASTRLSAAALDALRAHDWPGNVRELRNVVERAVLLSDGASIDVPALNLPANGALWPAAPPSTCPLPELDERQRIGAALSQCAGNQRRAAVLLGMPLRTLVRRIGQLGLPRPRGQRG
jgi:two-component system, NtrC family, response regulator AtoC